MEIKTHCVQELTTNTERQADILLVEDNPMDIRLTQEALRENKLKHRLHIAHDGEEALEFLKHIGIYKEAPRPQLILLDLHMPKKGGHEFLRELKTDKYLKRIPVIVLTSSKAENDINTSYDLYANCYLNKPLGFTEYTQLIEKIEQFWLKTAILPQD